jgi:tetratricopeptide (TPR) repeat protein
LASNVESDVLIWGWYDDLGIRLYILVGDEARTGTPTVTGLNELPLGAANEIGELSFYVHDVLPSNTTFLSMFVIGHLYYLSNNYAEGHQAFDAAMANIPETVALENEALLHFFNARLMQTTTFTDPAEIVCEYAKAIELDPNLFEAYNNLGVLMLDLDSRCEAGYEIGSRSPHEQLECVQATGISSLRPSVLFSQSLQIHPDWVLSRYNLAVLHYNYEQTRTRAQIEFESVLESDPSISGAHIALGSFAVWDGDFDAAVEHLATALELWPESSEVAVNLGQALALAERDEEAVIAYRQALTLDPQNIEAHLALGNLYHRRGELVRAQEEYQQVEEYYISRGLWDECAVLALARYEMDTGAWDSAVRRIESDCSSDLCSYLLWLASEMQGAPEADEYQALISRTDCLWGLRTEWADGDTNGMVWCDLAEWCAASETDDVSTWGSESNPCLPADLGERLEAVYDQFQHRLHYRLFFNKMVPLGMAACPYVFTWDERNGGWTSDTTALYKLIGPEAERSQARRLARFDGRLWLRELEPETSYVDQLYVRVLTADGRWLVLAPDDPALAADDGNYLILRQGDERLLAFDLPPDALPIQQTWVVAEGYYVPYIEEE